MGEKMADLEKSGLNSDALQEEKDKLLQDYSVKSERVHTINQLFKAYTMFEKDVEYVVIDNKVKIVDEQTGRIMEGRRYSEGLHQAIEAKESVKVEAATQTFATVTLQNYFRMYHKLAGMTGTAETEAGEFWDIYELEVVVIPTNRPIIRDDRQDLVFKTKREKYNAVIDEIVELNKLGRPVLVGTTSVEISELLSRMLKMKGIKHNVLNAKMHSREADIVAEAGQKGAVTIATNMAGRGTDIKLTDEVKAAGGLAIIGTERHDSRRVDRQLRGRAGRQGDPGSSQFYVSLEDDLMRLFGSDRISGVMDRLGLEEGEVIQHSMISKSIERAQKKVEENNFGIRKRLLEYDDVMNSQREVIYKKRRHALFGERLDMDVLNMMYDSVEELVNEYYGADTFDDFNMELMRLLSLNSPVTADEFKDMKPAAIIDRIYEVADNANQLANIAGSLAIYCLCVIIGLAFHAFVSLPLIVRFIGKAQPFSHMKNMATPLLTAFSTSSSSATLPLTMDALEHKSGVSNKITSFTLPLGATINMDGTALYECVAAMFIAQVYGVDLSFTQQILVVITALLASIGAAGIPMAGLVMITVVLSTVGLPLEGIGLILAVDRPLDMLRTSINVWSDSCGAVTIARSEAEETNVAL
jgi:preprotein translocase subunit SecA